MRCNHCGHDAGAADALAEAARAAVAQCSNCHGQPDGFRADPLRGGVRTTCPWCKDIRVTLARYDAERQPTSDIEGTTSFGSPHYKSEVADPHGWVYTSAPPISGDCRKLVWLRRDGFEWCGVRAYDHAKKFWLNNGEPETAKVLCWQDLPKKPLRFWSHGQLLQGKDDEIE